MSEYRGKFVVILTYWKDAGKNDDTSFKYKVA